MNGGAPGRPAWRLCNKGQLHTSSPTFGGGGGALGPPRLPRRLALRLPALTKGAMPMSRKTASRFFRNVVGLVGHGGLGVDGVGVGLLLFCGVHFGLDLFRGSDVGRLRE